MVRALEGRFSLTVVDGWPLAKPLETVLPVFALRYIVRVVDFFAVEPSSESNVQIVHAQLALANGIQVQLAELTAFF